MNPHLNLLHPYPFTRLRSALQDVTPPTHLSPIPLYIGEPKHPAPAIILNAITSSLTEFSQYPLTAGLPELRFAYTQWLQQRYGITLNSDNQVLPVLGSREALFSFVQALLNPTISSKPPIVISANPFYQIYEGATLLAGGEMVYANSYAPRFLPDWDSISIEQWRRCQLVFICSPNNPSGSVMQLDDWKLLFQLQDKYGFVIASDECYSEIYFNDNKPLGCLQAATLLGRNNFDKLVMFTSLSKRSNVPGMRSGFVAGDAELLKNFLLYRTYHGSAMSLPIQRASITAWNDEEHVIINRQLYQQKFAQILPILQKKFDVPMPDASFYLWLKVPDSNDLQFTRELYRDTAVQVLPGRFFARDTKNGNPGIGFVRIALVDTLEHCLEAAQRMVTWQK